MSHTGGKYINEGEYGCVFRPSLLCSDEKQTADKENSVSKLVYRSANNSSEIQIAEKLAEYDTDGQYFPKIIKRCSVSKLRPSDTAVNCKILQDERLKYNNWNTKTSYANILNKFENIVMTDLGTPLYHYIHKLPANFGPKDFYAGFLNVLQGIKIMHKLGYSHNDIHDGNILIDVSHKFRIIDFGLALSFDEMMKKSVKQKFLTVNGYIPEIIFINSLAQPDTTENHTIYAKRHRHQTELMTALRIILDEPRYKKLGNYRLFVENLQEFIKKHGVDKARMAIFHTIDTYSLAYYMAINIIIYTNTHSEAIPALDPLLNICRAMLDPYVSERLDLDGAIERVLATKIAGSRKKTRKIINMLRKKTVKCRVTSSRKYGGKFLDKGGYGCIYSPAIKCKNETRRKENSVSKIMEMEDLEIEKKHLDIVKKLDPGQKYFITYIEECPLGKLDPQEDNLNKCSLTRKTVKNRGSDSLHQIVMKNGGKSLYSMINSKKFMSKYLKNCPSLKSFLRHFYPIFEGLILLNKHELAHFDVKLENILFDGEKMRLIDFSILSNKFNYIKKNKTYFIYPPDLVTSRKDELKDLWKNLIKRFSILKFINVDELIDEMNIDNNFSMNVADKVDCFSLAICFLDMFDKLYSYYNVRIDNHILKNIYYMVWPNVYERVSLDMAYSLFRHYVENILH